MTGYVTKFGSLDDYAKGGIDLIDGDAKHYAFSNMFEVASHAKPWEKIAVGKNMEYVLEVIRAEGTSEWRTCAHDEFPLCMDGEVTVELVKLDTPLAPDGKNGSIAVGGEPVGTADGPHRPAHGPHGAAPGQRRVPLLVADARRDPAPDDPRRRHHRALGRDLPQLTSTRNQRPTDDTTRRHDQTTRPDEPIGMHP